MISKILNIAKNILLNTARDKGALIWLIVMPIVWTSLIGSMSGGSTKEVVPISVINYDLGSYGAKFEELLMKEDVIELISSESEEKLRLLIKDTKISVGIVIPSDFTDNLLSKKTSQVSLIKSDRSSSYFIEEVIASIAKRISIDAQAANFAIEKLAYFGYVPEDYRLELWERAFQISDSFFVPEPSIKVDYRVLSVEENKQSLITGMQLSSPGFAVMFVMMGVFFAGAVIVQERRAGTLARLITTPTGKFTIISGNMLGFFLLGLIQFSVLIAFGQIVLNVNWGRSPLGVLLVVLAFTLAVTGLGTLLSVFVRTSAQASAFAVLLSMVTSMIGGSWWPIEIAPSFMQKIARITPQYWAVNAFNNLITRGFGIESIIINLEILAGIAVVSLLLAVLFFRFE